MVPTPPPWTLLISIGFMCISAIVAVWVRGNIVPPSGINWHRHSSTNGWKTIHVYIGNSTYTVGQYTAPPRRDQANFFKSQVGQDKTIADIFDNKTDGFFVDLASNDAIELSNTYGLESAYNWRGICIEANSQYQWGLAHRRCEVVSAVVWNETNATVNFATGRGVYGGVVSNDSDNPSAQTSVALSAATLAEIFEYLHVPSVIDYLSFDVEGVEHTILSNFPFDRYIFLTLTVERPKPSLTAKLRENDYVYVRDHGDFGDQLWVHRSMPNFDIVLEKYGVGRGSSP